MVLIILIITSIILMFSLNVLSLEGLNSWPLDLFREDLVKRITVIDGSLVKDI